MNKYYDSARRERKKQRKKLMRLLQKQGYSEEEQLRIVDRLSGRTESGKEQAADELSAIIAADAKKEEVLAFVERYAEPRYGAPVQS